MKRWFIYTNLGLPEPFADVFTGISLFEVGGPIGKLTEFGELYRHLSLS